MRHAPCSNQRIHPAPPPDALRALARGLLEAASADALRDALAEIERRVGAARAGELRDLLRGEGLPV